MLVEYLIPALRMIMVPMILINLYCCWPSVKDAFAGILNPLLLYRTAIFFSLLPLLGFMLIGLFKVEPIGEGLFSFAFMLLFMINNIILIGNRYLFRCEYFEQFISLFDIQHSIPLVRLLVLEKNSPGLLDKLAETYEVQVLKDLIDDI